MLFLLRLPATQNTKTHPRLGPMMVCQGALRLGNFPIEEIIQNLVDFEQEHYTYLTVQDAIRLHALLATAYLRARQYIPAEQHVVRGLDLALRERALTMYLTDKLGTLTEICFFPLGGKATSSVAGGVFHTGVPSPKIPCP